MPPSRQTKKTTRNQRKTRNVKKYNKKQRGGVRTWAFDVDAINNGEFFEEVISNHLPDLCSTETVFIPNCAMGGLEPDNCEVKPEYIELGGRGASGSMDMCKFVINAQTGAITFEEVGKAENEKLGNLWHKTKKAIIALLMPLRIQTGANNI